MKTNARALTYFCMNEFNSVNSLMALISRRYSFTLQMANLNFSVICEILLKLRKLYKQYDNLDKK
jgi:hypothetical protein